MSHDHALTYWRPKRERQRSRRTLAITLAIAVAATICAGIATAATTITPLEPGTPPYTREAAVNITVNPVAVMFGRSSSTGNYTRTSPLLASCLGDNPAGTNNSPRTVVTVTGPGDVGVVHQATSPVIQRDLAGALGGYPEVNPQPAPSNTNYRGGAHGSTVSGHPSAGSTTRPWNTMANLEGKPAGIYTVTTETINMVRTTTLLNAGVCEVGTPPATSGTTYGNTFTPGPIVETSTFEYRPWQRVFTDVLGNGKVNVNIDPSEFQASTNEQTGQVHGGTAETMMFFNDPSSSSIMLPEDPSTCANDPNSCLPSTAVQCTPGTSGCNPRLLIINKGAPGDQVQGIFDLQDRVFIAYVNINGSQRVLFSLGSSDSIYRDLLAQLNDAAGAQGLDLMSILGTTARVRLGTDEYKLSVLNGLQIDPKPGGAADGVQIVADASAQAGLILNIFAGLSSVPCPGGGSADSDPSTAAPDRFTPTTDAGYTIEKSDLLPEVPRAGAVGALVGGPIYHIEGDFVTAGSTLVNTSTAVIGADTAEDEPNGYPVWIQPFLSGNHVENARTMDFLGTATFAASESDLGALGCLVVDFMLGAGVAIFNNPLPVGFGDIPIWDPQSPEVQALMAQVNAAVQDAVDQVTSDPTVAAVLDLITGSLPPVEGVPV